MGLSIAHGRKEALYGRVQKSAANPTAVGRDALLRRHVPALCQAPFLCCLSICSPHFPPKVERVRALSASHGGNPSPWATHRCRSVMPTSSASCLLEQHPPMRAGGSETRSPDRRNKAAREQCRRAGQGVKRTQRGAVVRS
jgi:hypothetical protein